MSELPTPSPEKYFLTLKEAARIIGVGKTFMYELMQGKRGVDPPRVVRMGSNYRIPTDEFREWVKRQTNRWPAKGKS